MSDQISRGIAVLNIFLYFLAVSGAVDWLSKRFRPSVNKRHWITYQTVSSNDLLQFSLLTDSIIPKGTEKQHTHCLVCALRFHKNICDLKFMLLQAWPNIFPWTVALKWSTVFATQILSGLSKTFLQGDLHLVYEQYIPKFHNLLSEIWSD